MESATRLRKNVRRISGPSYRDSRIWRDTFGLPMTELQREPESLLGTSAAAVNAAAAKYAAPQGTSLLLVGDLSKIEAGIKELKLGEIVYLDVEGRPVER